MRPASRIAERDQADLPQEYQKLPVLRLVDEEGRPRDEIADAVGVDLRGDASALSKLNSWRLLKLIKIK